MGVGRQPDGPSRLDDGEDDLWLEVGLVRRRYRRHLVGSTAAILRHDSPQLVLHPREDDGADAVGQRLVVIDEAEEAIGVEAEEGDAGWSGPDLGGRGGGRS